MKLVLFQTAPNGEMLPGLLTDRGVVDISGAVKKSYTPQLTMQGIIDDFDRLRPALEKLAARRQGRAARAGAAASRRCRGRARSSPASPTTGSTPSARRARSTCS